MSTEAETLAKIQDAHVKAYEHVLAIDAHYYRICWLYMGRTRCARNWVNGGPDVSGIRAYDLWRKWAGKEPVSFERKAGWQSGFGRFEDRIAALGSPMSEGCLMRRNAA